MCCYTGCIKISRGNAKDIDYVAFFWFTNLFEWMSTIYCNEYDTNDCKKDKSFGLCFIDKFNFSIYKKEKKRKINLIV